MSPSRPASRRAVLGAAAAGLLTACTGTGTGTGTSSSPTSAAPLPSPSEPPPSTPPAPPEPTVDLQAPPADVIARSGLPVLCYHQIRDWTPDDSAVDRSYIVPPATFTAQLDALAAGGWSTVGPEQLLAHLTTGAPLPERPVMLTYDDSVVDGYDVALPQMLERGFTATYFLMTVVLGKRRYLSADQVRELDAAGMTVGAHTWDHQRVDRYAAGDWRVQVDQPVQEIAEIVGHPVTTFAYPFGVWDPAAFEHLQAAGLTSAFQLDAEPMDPVRPLLTIRRSIANPAWSTEAFLAAVGSGS